MVLLDCEGRMTNSERRNYEEDVHLYLGFWRKKLNGDDCRQRCIRRIAKSDQDLDILKRELEVIGGHWRIHRTVNKRSTKKAFKIFQHYLIDNPDCAPYLDSVWKTILLQPESRAEKMFMIDIDFEDEKNLEALSIFVKPENIIERHKSPNGWHWIVKPFDRRILEGIPDVTVLTDGYIYLDSIGNKGLS